MSRVFRRLGMIGYYAREISPAYAALQVACTIDSQRALRTKSSFYRPIYAAKDRWVQKFLRREFSPLVRRWANGSPGGGTRVIEGPEPIWVLWLQGEANAPAVARKRISQMRKFANGHPVRVVDLTMLRELVDIPDSYYDKFERGLITPAGFSDIARVWLLSTYGGLWLDSSVYLARPIPDVVWAAPTWRGKRLEMFPYEPVCIDICEWQGYFWRSGPEDQLTLFVREFFEEYLERYERFLDYLLLNHIVKIGRELVPAIKRQYDAVPENNTLCEKLGPLLESGMQSSGEIHARFVDGESFAYKLSNRAYYPIHDRRGRKAVAADFFVDCPQ